MTNYEQLCKIQNAPNDELFNKDSIKTKVGSKIREKRKSINMSLEELSELINISPGFLGLIEKGKRGTSLKSLIMISQIFSCSVDELIGTGEYSATVCKFDANASILRLISYLSLLEMQKEEDINFLIAVMKSTKNYAETKQRISEEIKADASNG